MKDSELEFLKNSDFTTRIRNDSEYQEAIKLMEELIEDYERNRRLIDLLSVSIDYWENESEAFSEFNDAVASMPMAVAALRVLMDQNHMTIADQYSTDGDSQFVQGYLSLLDKNIQEMPENLRPLTQEFLSRIEDLVSDMEVDLDSDLKAEDD